MGALSGWSRAGQPHLRTRIDRESCLAGAGQLLLPVQRRVDAEGVERAAGLELHGLHAGAGNILLHNSGADNPEGLPLPDGEADVKEDQGPGGLEPDALLD